MRMPNVSEMTFSDLKFWAGQAKTNNNQRLSLEIRKQMKMLLADLSSTNPLRWKQVERD